MIYDPALVSPEGEATFRDIQRQARKRNKDPQAICQRFILERLTARLFESRHADKFALKGGMIMMLVEGVDGYEARATGDIDIHIPGFKGAAEDLDAIVREVISAPADRDDGIRWDMDAMNVSLAREGRVAGASVAMAAQVGKLRVKVHCDVGFDDRPVFDCAESDEIPSVLPDRYPPVQVRRVPFSWTLADKVQALSRHGSGTTRLRDFYDMFVILSKGKADPEQTAQALARTFKLFGTDLPDTAAGLGALSDEYAERNASAWEREKKSRRFAVATPSLPEIVRFVRAEIEPHLERAREIQADEAARPAA